MCFRVRVKFRLKIALASKFNIISSGHNAYAANIYNKIPSYIGYLSDGVSCKC